MKYKSDIYYRSEIPISYLYYDRVAGCVEQIESVNNLDGVAIIRNLHKC